MDQDSFRQLLHKPSSASSPTATSSSHVRGSLLATATATKKKQKTVDAISQALNFDATFVERLFLFAIQTNPEPNATTYSLESLRKHNILEHDASLTYDTQPQD